MSYTYRVDITDETVTLADSIQTGGAMEETLAKLMDNEASARFVVSMSRSTLSMGNILAHTFIPGAALGMNVQLVFLCGIRKVWKQCILDTSDVIPRALMDVAEFASFMFNSRSLNIVLPLPHDGVYGFLMRIRYVACHNAVTYALAHQDQGASDVICRVVLDHPSELVAQSIVDACMTMKVNVDVHTGDTVRRFFDVCITERRRRCRGGTHTTTPRATALCTWLCSLMEKDPFVAILVHDLIINDVLTRPSLSGVNLVTLGDVSLSVTRRTPYIPFHTDSFAKIPEEVRHTGAWVTIFDTINRIPPEDQCVNHSTWKVRRHY